MARLPTAADFGGRPIPQPSGGIAEDRSGQILARGLGVAGEALTALGQQQMEARDRDSYARARTAFLTADLETRDELARDPDFVNSEQRYRDAMTKNVAESSKLIRSNPDRAAFAEESRLDLLRGSLHVKEVAWGKEVTAGVAEMNATVDNGRKLYLSAKNPDDRAAILRNIQDTIASKRDLGYIDDTQAQKAMENVSSDFSEAFAITLDPKPRAAYLDPKQGPSAADMIPGDRRAVLYRQALNEIEAEDETARIEAAKVLSNQMADRAANNARGILPTTELPSEATFQYLYDSKEEGTRARQHAIAFDQAGARAANAHSLSNSELQARTAAAEMVPGAIGEQAARIDRMITDQIMAYRDKDAAGYLAEFDPTVKKALENIDTNMPGYFAAVEAAKQFREMTSPDTLPDALVTQITDRITNAGTAEQMSGMVKLEEQRWGDYWADVFPTLAPNLPPLVAVAASGVSDQTGARLMSMAKLTPEDIAVLIPAGTTTADVKTEVSTAMAEFFRSIPPDGAQTAAAVFDAAYMLTVSDLSRGVPLANAAANARTALVDYQDNMTDIRGMAVRIPVVDRKTNSVIDPGTVQRGSEEYLQRYYKPTAVDIVGLEQSALSPEENIDNLQREVQLHGYWLTNPKATGLRLYLGSEPMHQNGQTVDVPWAQLIGITPLTINPPSIYTVPQRVPESIYIGEQNVPPSIYTKGLR